MTAALDLFDTHCHLTSQELVPVQQRVIEDAFAAGVNRMITVAVRPQEARQALALHGQHPGIHVAVGVHPHEAGRIDAQELRELDGLWRERGVVAAGEMGLDYHYNFSPREAQQDVFHRQLDLVAPTSLPLIIHCREAHADVVQILRRNGYVGRKVVFHCFSGTRQEAAEIRSCGWRTSFTGIITFKNADEIRQAMLETPLDELMFETDAPYLSPEPVRRMRPNEPKNVHHTVAHAGMLRGMDAATLAALTTTNACRFFRVA